MLSFRFSEMRIDPQFVDDSTGVAWLVRKDDGPHNSNVVRKNQLITVKPDYHLM